MPQERISAADFRRAQLVDMSEGQFQTDVVALAERRRWRHYHTYDSRRSAAGYPDLTLARRGSLIIAELKAVTGSWGDGQREWLAELAGDDPADWHFGRIVGPYRAAGLTVIYACWTPLDWDLINEVLR